MKEAQRELVTRIVAQLEQGTAPWVRPWSTSGISDMPHNIVSRRPYHGVNVLQLWGQQAAMGYATAEWCTFLQAKELGAGVRKGEKGTPVWFIAKRTWTAKDADTGDEEMVEGLVWKQFVVFNRAQCDGLPSADTAELPPFSSVESAEAYVRAIGADVRHGGDLAFYLPATDYIMMPHPERFVDAASYYGTLLHEHIHYTGAETRLARKLKNRFGDRDYAFEELVAELGSAFACAQLRLPSLLRHAEYLAIWARALDDDPKALWTAAAHASRAVDFLDGKAGCCEPPAIADAA